MTRSALASMAANRSRSPTGRRSPRPESAYTARTSATSRSAPAIRSIFCSTGFLLHHGNCFPHFMTDHCPCPSTSDRRPLTDPGGRDRKNRPPEREFGPPEGAAVACLGVRETRDRLRQGRSTVTDHVGSVLEDIGKRDGELGAYVSVAGDEALRAAAAADARIRALGPAAWRDRPLLGVTVSVKDLIQTADLPTLRGSLLPNRRARADAPAVARL